MSRLALCVGAVCGAVYGLCFWLNRFGHLSDWKSIGYLVGLTTVPAAVLVLVRLPHAATYLWAGFLIGSTTFIVLSALLLDVIGLAPPNRMSSEAT